MEGLHLTADCFDCTCHRSLLLDQKELSDIAVAAALQAGLTVVGEKFHSFSNPDGSAAGVTCALLLAESHIAIHTWPERNAVTLDVYVCNFNDNNSDKARDIIAMLVEAFQPASVSRQQLTRGRQHDAPAVMTWEKLTPHTAYGTQLGHTIAEASSSFQHIQISESAEFGKIMRIDDAYMTSERDEFFYHECLVHPAALAHPAPRRALIIGGGDGGSTEELLKHPGMEHVSLCEIDAEVVRLSRAHLQNIHHGKLDDSRVEHVHADGFAFIREATDSYDLILLDLTDPVTPSGTTLAAGCVTVDFFADCKRRLSQDGCLVMHLGSPFYHPQRFAGTVADLRKSFRFVRPYTVFVPLYGALWGMAIASNTLDPCEPEIATLEERIRERRIGDLQYYNAEIHKALFVLPNFVQNLLHNNKQEMQ
ncbi:polyamine aminopropyltransferase [Undibacterium terreum]|uniref:Polyamine aminopropyltransferase n=1 Tax=Undibacterium terreum TaxID=1224302 RepID=A0A916XGX9_9BURK|nr:polyamine aminopropyltransferase [Undibacterium terreum]GGC72568.1 hypothetical protein GCM10011396_19640 [Undibacterium terreum]